MTVELTMLAWTLVLALVQVFLPTFGKTSQYGAKWNAGPRDEEMPAPSKVTGRLDRAQRNLYETLPVFAAAVLAVHVTGKEAAMTAIGAQLYFWARLAYLPLYALGVPIVRSLVWLVSLLGLVMILLVLLGLA